MPELKKDDIYWIWYANIPKIDNAVKIKLLEGIDSPREIFRTAGACLKNGNVSEEIISKVRECCTADNIEKYASIMERYPDIGVVSFYDFDYPRMLCQISDPPLVLYYIGDISILHKRCIGVVGTRDSSEKGNYNARSFARELASAGYTVVSGMARGIDASAHIGALGAGNTAAVLACGVDVVYPRENKELYNMLCQRGVVISEMLPGTKVTRYSFLFRNRIISGLSESVLVVEAPAKSGAMNTATHACKQNRDVYVFADSSEDPQYGGNRELIEEGAIPVTSPFDIIKDTSYTAFDAIEIQNIASGTKEEIIEETAVHKDYSILSESELSVLSIIRSGTDQFDEIVLQSGSDIASVGLALTMLEFKGFIIQKVGKVYEEV